MASYSVRIKDTQSFAKVRSPVWSIVLSFFTLGIYGMYWWYQVNRELRDLGRARGTHELGDSPGTSLAAVTVGWLIIVPPFVSIYKGVQRLQAAQRLAGMPESQIANGWIMLGLIAVSAVTYIPFGVGFIQSELNKVWAHDDIADRPTEAAPAAIPPPAPAPPAGAPTAPPPPAAVVAAPATADPQLERLERLAALRDSGAITPEDYDAQKAKILDQL
jgi:Domain of unknown function (DUF4234)/Short C-terminal domain